MGDATQDIEKEIQCDKVDVLKVRHHGSDTSTSSNFLNKVQPKYIVISSGYNKNYNHPSKLVLQRLKDAGIQENNIYITKNQGTIWITSDWIYDPQIFIDESNKLLGISYFSEYSWEVSIHM